MMESVRRWNEKVAEEERITISLELEKPGKHPVDVAELADVVFISRIYAETELRATDKNSAVALLRQRVEKP